MPTVDGAHNPCSSVSSECRFHGRWEPPPHDVSGKHNHIDKALPWTNLGEIIHPQLVSMFCHELTIHAFACGNDFPTDCSAALHRQVYEVRGQSKDTIIYCDSNNVGVSFYHYSVFRLTRLCDYWCSEDLFCPVMDSSIAGIAFMRSISSPVQVTQEGLDGLNSLGTGNTAANLRI